MSAGDDVAGPQPPPIRVADLATAVPDGTGTFTDMSGPSLACAPTLAADRAKLDAAVTKACGAVAPADLRAALGLGYAAADGPCAELEAPAPASVTTLAACVATEHACRADALASFAAPRTAALLASAGIDLTPLACLARGSSDAGGLAVDARKPAAKCQQALAKAGAKLVDETIKAEAACARGVLACLQQKADDPKCLPKARSACGKRRAKATGLAAKHDATVAKACDVAALPFATVLAADGLDLGTRIDACAALTEGTLDSVAALAACVRAHHTCRATQILESAAPRVRELSARGGTPLP